LAGQGVPKDLQQAAEWYKKAAEQGYSPAQTVLGKMYVLGQGAPRDSSKAAYWHKKSLKPNKHIDFTLKLLIRQYLTTRLGFRNKEDLDKTLVMEWCCILDDTSTHAMDITGMGEIFDATEQKWL
jgi:TPR repeat protein